MPNYKKKGKEYMRRLAAKGGKNTLRKWGLNHLSVIGKVGNKAMREKLSTFK